MTGTISDRDDTIVAPATPPGRGGIGIVRISGPATRGIATAMLGAVPAARHAALTTFSDAGGESIDSGIALFFPAPHSFTGEDVLELHGHGGPVVMDRLVARAIGLGARNARPGEFSERAFLNGKLDLAQAEAIADLIAAGSEEAARAALRLLSGEFSRAIGELAARIMELRVLVEAAIDFPDEEVEFLGEAAVRERAGDISTRFEQISRLAGQGRLLRDGLRVVIAGRPNAGKSSLLNALAGHEAAIVTPIPGTTRDALREHIQIDGLPLHVVDTAGLRETSDVVESEGVRRTLGEIRGADLVLYVVDAAAGLDPAERAHVADAPAVAVVWNKTDLTAAQAAPTDLPVPVLPVSALTGAGMPALRERLKALAGYQPAGAGVWSARRRHLDALGRASRHVVAAAARLADRTACELVAEELRLAQQALGEITGEVTSDELLAAVFADFCIGK
ncbi:MAG: tRNA uridine-5-carboxymethylaminomethyl(34) synthesis GTPase MnmE [Gammaproteobacteria bacterium]|nr:tRNA uridine-5-carboxymethylaminomethyl(34) synthesis GTPase MnmE [Gammaproteobacteria bacterium]